MKEPMSFVTLAGVLVSFAVALLGGGYYFGRQYERINALQKDLEAVNQKLDILWDLQIRRATAQAVHRRVIIREAKNDD